jgi:hypothetical protein
MVDNTKKLAKNKIWQGVSLKLKWLALDEFFVELIRDE